MKFYLIVVFGSIFFMSTKGQTLSNTPHGKTPKEVNGDALAQWRGGAFDSALSLLDIAQQIAQEQHDSFELARCLNNIGLVYNSKGDAIKSLFYYEQSLGLLRTLNNKEKLPTALLNIGIAYKEQAIYDKALAYLFEAVSEFERANDSKQLSSAYNTIGNIFMLQMSYSKSLEFHEKALQLRKQIEYSDGIAGSLNNIGIVYKRLKHYDSALIYFKASLAFNDENKRLSEHYANTLSHIADIYVIRDNFLIASQYYDSAYNIRKRIGSKKGVAHSLYELGTLAFSRKSYKKSEQLLVQCIALGKEINASDIVLRCYTLLRQLYRATKNNVKALLYDDLYISLREQILGEEKQQALVQMQIAYEAEKSQQTIHNLQQEKEKQATLIQLRDATISARNTQTLVAVLSACLFIFIGLSSYRRYRTKDRHAKEVDFLNREIHHRVSNNLQTLSSVFELQIAHIKDTQAKRILETNIDRITAMGLIHQRLNRDKSILEVIIKDYLHSLVENIRFIFGRKTNPVQVEWSINSDITIPADKAIAVGLIVNELVNNAFKYAFGPDHLNPILKISMLQNPKGQNILVIQDNGSLSELPKREGSFGLKLVDSQIKVLKGSIDVKIESGLKYEVTF